MKLENVANATGIAISVKGANSIPIARVDVPDPESPHGTSDWKEHSAVISVPPNAQAMRWGFVLAGPGKMWVDLDSALCELADGAQGL